MNTQSRSESYAAAGVDITAGYRAVELMKSHIARTMMRYMNLNDDCPYVIELRPSGTGCRERKRYKPNIRKFEQM